MKKRYQKQSKPEMPSRRKLASELAEQKQRAEQATQLARNVAHSTDILRERAFRAEDENQRLVKQIEKITSAGEYIRVVSSPNYSSRNAMMESAAFCRVGMPRFHVGIDLEVCDFQRHDRGHHESLIEAIADQMSRETRAVVLKNLRILSTT